jgi:uncharacterized coiled-coil protein SlyX
MKKIITLAVATMMLVSCRDTAAENKMAEQQRTMDSIKIALQQQKIEMAKQKTIDSMNAIANQRSAEAAAVAASTTAAATTNSASAPAATKRKGWSNTAKGAVIGAGVGAVTGAVVSKKDGEGAIIGGLAGAAVGAGTGAVIDSKKK